MRLECTFPLLGSGWQTAYLMSRNLQVSLDPDALHSDRMLGSCE